MIAVGVQNPGTVVKAIAEPNLVTGFTAVASIVFSYGTFCGDRKRRYAIPTLHSEPQYFLQHDFRIKGSSRVPESVRNAAMY
jgi:hypothetical protein